MKKFLLIAIAVVSAAYAGLYFYTQPMLRASGSDAVAKLPRGDANRGKRLATIVGCRSCHGPDLGGKRFIAEDYVFRLVAPDLTRARERYDDAAFVRLFRTGAKVGGNLALGMPTQMQQRMTDAEVADIIAFVRSVPTSAAPVQESTRLYPLARIGLVMGKYHPHDGDPAESEQVLLDRQERNRGRHLAQIACAECHGGEFEGNSGMGAPALAIAKGYSRNQFTRLLHTGTTLAGTESKTGLMTEMARERFTAMTDAETRDLHGFLTGATASRQPSPPSIVRKMNVEIGSADEMMTPEELETWKRNNAESMKALEHVPELKH